jgi:hypothetical protein
MPQHEGAVVHPRKPARAGPLDRQRIRHPHPQPTQVTLVGHLEGPSAGLSLQDQQLSAAAQMRPPDSRSLAPPARCLGTVAAAPPHSAQEPHTGRDLLHQTDHSTPPRPPAVHDRGVFRAHDPAGQPPSRRRQRTSAAQNSATYTPTVGLISGNAVGMGDRGRRWSQSGRECPPTWSQFGRSPAALQLTAAQSHGR